MRARDGKYVFSGVVNHRAYLDQWVGFKAAHIFPLDNLLTYLKDNYKTIHLNMAQTYSRRYVRGHFQLRSWKWSFCSDYRDETVL